jgi:hypothetical protein
MNAGSKVALDAVRIRSNEKKAGTDLFLGLMGKNPRPESRHRLPCLPAPSVLGASYELPIFNYTEHIRSRQMKKRPGDFSNSPECWYLV